MNDYLNAHTWLCCTTFWNLAKLTFVLVCGLGSLGFLIYCVAVVIGSFVEAQQERSTRRRLQQSWIDHLWEHGVK